MNIRKFYLKHKDFFEIGRGYIGGVTGIYYALSPNNYSIIPLFLGTFIVSLMYGLVIFGGD